MQNKPFIFFFGYKIAGVSNDDLLGLSNLNEDLYPCIPNSSLDSRSNESTVRR
jgi:hypothetical protein